MENNNNLSAEVDIRREKIKSLGKKEGGGDSKKTIENLIVFLVLLIIVGLVIGWMVTLKNVSGIDDINKQKKLVEQADQFDEKQLYIRGIPLLKEALNIQTKNNPDIERKLLGAYREHGNVDDYYDLLLKMDILQIIQK